MNKKRAHTHGMLLLILVQAILLFACIKGGIDTSSSTPKSSGNDMTAGIYYRY